MELKNKLLITSLIKSYNFICNNYQALLILALLFLIFPFVFIGFYNVPVVDDFAFGKWGHAGNTFEILKNLYLNENGRYFALFFLITINPLVYSNFALFSITPLILLLILFCSLYFTIKQIFKDTSVKVKFLLSLLSLYIFIVSMPDTAEGLYWFTGSYTHTFPFALSTLLIGLFVKLSISTELKRKVLLILLITSIQFIIIGCQEIVLLAYTSLLFFYTLYVFINKSKHRKTIFIIFILAILFSFIELLAPGNFVRMETTKNANRASLLYSLYGSFILFLRHIPNFISQTLIPVFSIFIFPVLLKYRNKIDIIVINPIISIIFSSAILFLLFLPGTYSMVGTFPRMMNDIYFVFIVLWFYNLINISAYLVDFKLISKIHYSLKTLSLILIIYIIIFSFSLNSNYRKIISDIKSKRIFEYHAKINERFDYLEKNKGASTIEIIQIDKLPKSLSTFDVQTDKDNWQHIGYKVFYGFNEIKGKSVKK